VLGSGGGRQERNPVHPSQYGTLQFPFKIGSRKNARFSQTAGHNKRILAVERENNQIRNLNHMKTRLETLESIHDSLLEEKLRLEIAIRNLEGRKDDDVIIPRLNPFSLDGQKTKKEVTAEYGERIEKVEHAILTTKKLIEEEYVRAKILPEKTSSAQAE